MLFIFINKWKNHFHLQEAGGSSLKQRNPPPARNAYPASKRKQISPSDELDHKEKHISFKDMYNLTKSENLALRGETLLLELK